MTHGPATAGEITVRVRYAECDRMGILHHANYFVYFEMGRLELLRATGRSYKELEDEGFLLVLTRFEVRYKKPAVFDDVLTLRTTVEKVTMVRIDHRYELLRGGELLCEAWSTLACVDHAGRPQGLPEFLQPERGG